MPYSATTQAKVSRQNATSFAPMRGGLLQRKCASGGAAGSRGECASMRDSSTDHSSEIPPIVHEVLNSPGQPLDPATRALMERIFGHDFGNVRVHTDGKAADSARAVHAHAYTAGRDVVFGANEFAPATQQGRELIAHELAHTIQIDRSGSGDVPARVPKPEEPAEIEAHRAAASVASGRHFAPSSHPEPGIYRDDKKTKSAEKGTGERKTFLHEGFTGRETEEKARLIAASKGWVVQGAMYWNGWNWIGEDVRPGTGSERAVAQVKLDLENLGEVSEELGAGEMDIGEGFEGTSVYTGEEKPHERKFGEGESKTGEGEAKEGKQGEREGEKGSKEEATGTQGTGTGQGANEIDPLTAFASFALDPSSLSELKKNTSGESGSPAGGIGFIKGALAKVLTVFAAALTFFTGPVLKLLGKLKGLAGKIIGSLGDKLRRLFGITPKTLPPGSRPPVPPTTPEPVPVPEPEPVPEPLEGEITERLPNAQAAGGETIGEFRVVGERRINGDVLEREIRGLYHPKTTDIRPLRRFIDALIDDARAAGVSQLRIRGEIIANKNVLRLNREVARVGGTIRKIDEATNEIIIPIPR
jgi:hypothetical protein